MATIPSSTFTASKVHQSIVNERPGGHVDQSEQLPLQYNSKLMNSIWGLYNRYAPPAFQKNNEPQIRPNSGAPNSQIRSVSLVIHENVNLTIAYDCWTGRTCSWKFRF